jgi:hypothetical protein
MYAEEPFWNPGFPSEKAARDFVYILMKNPVCPPNPEIVWIYNPDVGLGCWYGNDPPAQDWTAKIIFLGTIP